MQEAFYKTPAESQRSLGIVCTGYGAMSHKTGACLGRTLNCYAAIWVSEGLGWLETSATRQPFVITQGTLFWLFPGVTHSYSPGETGWSEHWVLFEGKLAHDFEQTGLLSRQQPVKSLAGFTAITSLFDQIKTDFIKGGPQTVVLSGMLIGRLIAEVNRMENWGTTYGNATAALVTQVMDWLDEHFDERIDFARLASVKGVGYSTFRRYFKQLNGLPPQEYLQNLRITKAKKMLVSSELSIKQIAVAAGFNDPYYFSRVFHNEVGLAPSEFRLQQQLGAGKPASR